MKKALCLILLCLFSMTSYAMPFPLVKRYVINGVVIGGALSDAEMLKYFGKPTSRLNVRNDCLETTEIFVRYPSVIFKDGAVDKVLFSHPKTRIQLSTMIIDANTTVVAIKKLGQTYVSTEKGITTYRIEDTVTNDAWNFEFKAGRLYAAYLAIDDC